MLVLSLYVSVVLSRVAPGGVLLMSSRSSLNVQRALTSNSQHRIPTFLIFSPFPHSSPSLLLTCHLSLTLCPPLASMTIPSLHTHLRSIVLLPNSLLLYLSLAQDFRLDDSTYVSSLPCWTASPSDCPAAEVDDLSFVLYTQTGLRTLPLDISFENPHR